jgi:exonuclease III
MHIHKRILLKLKSHTEPPIIIVGDVNITLSAVEKSWKQKLNRDSVKLIEVMNQMDLTYIFKTFHQKIKEYTFFSASHWTVSNTEHMISNRICLNRSYQITID